MLLTLTSMALSQSFFGDSLPLANHTANESFEQGNYEEALKGYLDLYGQDTTNGAVAYNIGNTYMAMGNPEKAKQFYDRAIKSPHAEASKRALFNLGYLNLQNQDPKSAVERYVQYLQDNPHDLDAKRNLEQALRLLEQQEQQQQQQDENSEQQESQQQPSDDQSSQSSDSQESQEQQSQSSDAQDENSENNDQQQESNPSDQTNPPDRNDQDQGADQPQDPSDAENPSQSEPQDSGDNPYNDEMKEQILQALQDQEMQQQKEYQKRKIGAVKRRAKDW